MALIYSLSKEYVDQMKEKLRDNFEWCGYYVEDYDILVSDEEASGQDGNGVRMCSYPHGKDAASKFYHTHPLSSKSYPSTEDIMFMASTIRKVSFIFTYWGIWIIYRGLDQNNTVDKEDYHFIQYAGKIKDSLYKRTQHSKDVIGMFQARSFDYDAMVQAAIKEYLDQMNRLCDSCCRLAFVAYEDLDLYINPEYQDEVVYTLSLV
jgi:hypothetical protein